MKNLFAAILAINIFIEILICNQNISEAIINVSNNLDIYSFLFRLYFLKLFSKLNK